MLKLVMMIIYSLIKWEQQPHSPAVKRPKYDDAHFYLQPKFQTCGVSPQLPHHHGAVLKHSGNQSMVTAIIK
jgi:hypothetical protein